MRHQQFESELAHLEGIVLRLTSDGPFSLTYWRSRAAVLVPYQNVVPSGMARMRRLLGMLDKVERKVSVDPRARRDAAPGSTTPPFR